MYRIRFILTGAVFGIAWACSLRGFMQQLAGADSTFTFAGTFGVIIPAGVIVGALLGWAEYQRRAGRQHRLLILAPLLIGIIPVVFTAQLDMGPISLAQRPRYPCTGRQPAATRLAQRPPSLTGSGASRFDLHSTSAALVTLPDTYRRILLRDPVIFLG